MAQLPPLAVSAAYQLGFRRTQSLSAQQHLALLGYLCDELLDTHAVRDTLQSALHAWLTTPVAKLSIWARHDHCQRIGQAVHSPPVVCCICTQLLARHAVSTCCQKLPVRSSCCPAKLPGETVSVPRAQSGWTARGR